MYLSVQEQEEVNSVLMRFETPHRVPVLNLTLSHIFLFACLICGLYVFVQMQDDAKERCEGSVLLSVRRAGA